MKIIQNNEVIYCFKSDMKPVKSINQGEVFKVKTNDCFFGQITSESQLLSDIDYSRLNPATGPIFVEGAESGDLLKVKIIKIDVASQGVSLTMPNEGVLGKKATKALTRIIPVNDGYCHFNGLSIPIKPMIGVIGVAPCEEDGEWPTHSPWRHGGNMDTTDICEGATIYFPVRQKGALLALGDCHAIMGDGEVCFTGCEIAAEVTLQVDVIKEKATSWPVLENSNSTMIIASGNTSDDAIVEATDQAVNFLSKGLDLTWEDAYILASLAVDLKISQVVDPKSTVRAVIPKAIISTEDLLAKIL